MSAMVVHPISDNIETGVLLGARMFSWLTASPLGPAGATSRHTSWSKPQDTKLPTPTGGSAVAQLNDKESVPMSRVLSVAWAGAVPMINPPATMVAASRVLRNLLFDMIKLLFEYRTLSFH